MILTFESAEEIPKSCHAAFTEMKAIHHYLPVSQNEIGEKFFFASF